jgi:hypothetical protein
MTSMATLGASNTAKAAASQPALTTVAASGGSPTTSREPPGQRAAVTGAGHAANGKFEDSGKPGVTKAAKFAAVRMAIRVPELAKWIVARPSFTFAEAAAARAPSPCSHTVMAYTLADPALASALAGLGKVITAGGKNGYTVTALTSFGRTGCP